MTLARACWSITAFVLFVCGVIVLVEGYIGYAIVTLVISAAAAINLLGTADSRSAGAPPTSR